MFPHEQNFRGMDYKDVPKSKKLTAPTAHSPVPSNNWRKRSNVRSSVSKGQWGSALQSRCGWHWASEAFSGFNSSQDSNLHRTASDYKQEAAMVKQNVPQVSILRKTVFCIGLHQITNRKQLWWNLGSMLKNSDNTNTDRPIAIAYKLCLHW